MMKRWHAISAVSCVLLLGGLLVVPETLVTERPGDGVTTAGTAANHPPTGQASWLAVVWTAGR
jgi:hypothetical protein